MMRTFALAVLLLGLERASGFAARPAGSLVARRHAMRAVPRTQVRMSDGGEEQLPQVAAGGINTSGEPPFEIRGFSLATSFLVGGFVLTVASFGEYFAEGGGAGLGGIGFVYGIPVLLIGLSLKYAELAPVEVVSTPQGEAAFEAKATETLKKIKQDVTRHRYGDDAHLDSTLKSLGLQLPQKEFPTLEYLQEETTNEGELAFSMVFRSPETPYKIWAEEDRVKRYETFFGPGLNAEVVKVNAEERLVAIKLTTGEKPAEPKAAEPAPKEAAEESA